MCLEITYNLISFIRPYIPRHKDYSTIKVIALSALGGMVLWLTYVMVCLSDRKIVKQQPGRSKIQASPHAQKFSKTESKAGTPSETKTAPNLGGETSQSSPILRSDIPLIDITMTVEKKKTAQNSKDVDHSIEPKRHRTKPAVASLRKIQKIKNKNAEQVKLFEAWAAEGRWETFKPKYSHYDWWAFPIKRPSRGYGYTFAVNEKEIQALKADEVFMRNYRTGVELVVKSWGWDLTKDAPIPQTERTPDQSWTGYEVRLGKMADSLQLFGEQDLYESLKHFFDQVCVPSAEKYPISEWVCKLFGRSCPCSK